MDKTNLFLYMNFATASISIFNLTAALLSPSYLISILQFFIIIIYKKFNSRDMWIIYFFEILIGLFFLISVIFFPFEMLMINTKIITLSVILTLLHLVILHIPQIILYKSIKKSNPPTK
jgi:hypothetical protein